MTFTRRRPAIVPAWPVDLLLALVAVGGVLLGPLSALWAFLDSPCGPDSTADTCVLAAPHATAVLFPLVAGPAAAVATVALAIVLRGRPGVHRRVFAAGALAVVATLVVPLVILALAPHSYPNAYVPR